jgi:concanavalin A-like lectin/glucanase superfamily protein
MSSRHHYYQPGTAPFRRLTGGLGLVGNDAYTTALLHMDGADASTTFTDSNAGGAAKTWTAAGNAQIDTASSKFGGASGLFDQVGDYISTPAHADFNFGTGDFTIDSWFSRNGGNGTFRRMLLAETTGFTACYSILLTSTNVVQAVVSYPSLGNRTITGTTAFTSAGFNHAALVRNGDTMTLYVNGVSEGTPITGLSGQDVRDPTGPLIIGAGANGESDFWNGWLDEMRVSKGIARWTAGFTPPTGAYGP